MIPTIVYVMPNHADDSYERAVRFVSSYQQAPPGCDHYSLVVVNDGNCDTATSLLFAALRNCRLIAGDNAGWDIGAFQLASRMMGTGLLVCFGSSAWLPREGWLARMIDARERNGNCVFGSHGNMGNPGCGVYPHVRTTGFFLDADLFNQYPMLVDHPSKRYPFEHGHDCLSEWARSRNIQVILSTFIGDFPRQNWDYVPNGFHRGDQSSLLVRDRLTDPPFYQDGSDELLNTVVMQRLAVRPFESAGGNR